MHYLHEDGPSLSTMFATGLVTEVRVQDLVGWDSGISHTLLSSQHPYDHIWHAVLRLKETWNISITQSFDPVLELHYIVLLITMTPWTFFSREKHFLTSSASCLSLSNQSSISPTVALTSVASSLTRVAICLILSTAASRRLFIWRSSSVMFCCSSRTGSCKLSHAHQII